MATLMFKVFALSLKTISKPLALRFEKLVMDHPVARRQVINIAQWLHRMEVALTRGAEGRTGRVFVADMTEEHAVHLASKVASEGFVYAVGIGLVVLELDRKRKEDDKKKAKEAAEKAEIGRLHEQHLQAETTLSLELGELRGQVGSLRQQVGELREVMQRIEDGQRRRWLGIL
eukprot:scaffold7.g3483.t1